jgi:hypothetical protein
MVRNQLALQLAVSRRLTMHANLDNPLTRMDCAPIANLGLSLLKLVQLDADPASQVAIRANRVAPPACAAPKASHPILPLPSASVMTLNASLANSWAKMVVRPVHRAHFLFPLMLNLVSSASRTNLPLRRDQVVANFALVVINRFLAHQLALVQRINARKGMPAPKMASVKNANQDFSPVWMAPFAAFLANQVFSPTLLRVKDANVAPLVTYRLWGLRPALHRGMCANQAT